MVLTPSPHQSRLAFAMAGTSEELPDALQHGVHDVLHADRQYREQRDD